MILPSKIVFRLTALLFAGFLGLQAAWILAPELVRFTWSSFLYGKASVDVAHRDNAVTAAALGMLRGDLWADYAVILASERSDAGAKPPSLELVRNAAMRAVTLAPHESRAWLVLANLDRLNPQGAEALKMSFYTGPYEVALIPEQIRLATRLNVTGDDELQNLIAQEISIIIFRRPELKPAIIAAYRDASPDGKQFIETTVGTLDPNLLTEIRAINLSGQAPLPQ
jgi:hypothetical protein